MVISASISRKDSIIIANLHLTTINEGFLSELGLGFLKSLYTYLIQKELVIVFKEKEQVLGFVSCALSSSGIMKRFLFASPLGILRLLVAILKNPQFIKPLMETYKAPKQSKSIPDLNIKIPETELLSISVSPLAQKGGIGTQLLQGLEDELIKRGITSYKVIAGEKLEGANKFYKKNGFVLAKQISIHGNAISNVYVKNLN